MSVVRLYRMIPTGDTELLLASGPHRAVVHPWCFPEALFSRQEFSSMPDGGTGTINDAEVKVPATHYLELAETLTPTGRPASNTVSPTWYETKRSSVRSLCGIHIQGRLFLLKWMGLLRHSCSIPATRFRNPEKSLGHRTHDLRQRFV